MKIKTNYKKMLFHPIYLKNQVRFKCNFNWYCKVFRWIRDRLKCNNFAKPYGKDIKNIRGM